MHWIERVLLYSALVGLILTALGGSAVSEAQAQQDNVMDRLSVRAIEVVGADGKPLLVIDGKAPKGALVRVLQRNGKTGVELRCDKVGGHLLAYNASGKQACLLGVDDPTKVGLLQLSDARGAVRVETAVEPQGGFLRLVNRANKDSTLIGAYDEGEGYLVHFGTRGKHRFQSDGRETGGSMYAWNSREKRIFFLGSATRVESGVLLVSNAAGQGLAEIGMGKRGGYISLKYTDRGNPVGAGMGISNSGLSYVATLDREGERTGALGSR
jgi:hypothetical protein